MEFQEIFTSQFTSNTTCYSGAHDAKSLCLATENHVLSIHGKGCQQVPRDNTTAICVGYSKRDELEALALLDPAQLEDMDVDHRPNLSSPPPDQPSKDDSQSVVSTSHSVSTESRRRSSQPGGGGGTVSTVSSTTNSASTTTTPKAGSEATAAITTATSAGSNASQPDAPLSTTAGLLHNMGDKEDEDKVLLLGDNKSAKSRMARLILKDASTKKEYSTFLDVRPLCPCVSPMGIWVGSADDSLLRLYVPKEDAGGMRRLQDVNASLLPREHFTFPAPIMALDYLEAVLLDRHNDDRDDDDVITPTRILAVACQDGTVQVVAWKTDNFQDVTSKQVIVDGPLVCLQLSLTTQDKKTTAQDETMCVRLVVGSLCGYVCEMLYDTPSNEKQWGGPFMIMKQGFWNQALEAEDSVLAVSAWTLSSQYVYIAMGTQSGRVILYRKDPGKKDYCKVWECLLPYSVHGVVTNSKESSVKEAKDEALQLVVTTRRSVHIFEETNKGFDQRKTQEAKTEANLDVADEYSATLAKTRLQALLGAKEGEEKILSETSDEDGSEGDWIKLPDKPGEPDTKDETIMMDDPD